MMLFLLLQTKSEEEAIKKKKPKSEKNKGYYLDFDTLEEINKMSILKPGGWDLSLSDEEIQERINLMHKEFKEEWLLTNEKRLKTLKEAEINEIFERDWNKQLKKAERERIRVRAKEEYEARKNWREEQFKLINKAYEAQEDRDYDPFVEYKHKLTSTYMIKYFFKDRAGFFNRVQFNLFNRKKLNRYYCPDVQTRAGHVPNKVVTLGPVRGRKMYKFYLHHGFKKYLGIIVNEKTKRTLRNIDFYIQISKHITAIYLIKRLYLTHWPAWLAGILTLWIYFIFFV